MKKEDFVRLRINGLEKKRLEKLVTITCRKRSDLFRDAIFIYMKEKFPECLA